MDMDRLIDLAKLKQENPKKYAELMKAMKEVAKDITQLTIDISKEIQW